jgi:hypothetical protein
VRGAHTIWVTYAESSSIQKYSFDVSLEALPSLFLVVAAHVTGDFFSPSLSSPLKITSWPF